MTAWFIASIPFWIVGAIMFISVALNARDDIRNGECNAGIFFFGMAVTAVCWLIAARICS